LLVYSYNNGLIIGSNASYSRTFNPPNAKHVNSIRINGEISGLLTGGGLANLTKDGYVLQDLYRFAKLDVGIQALY
jgi:hypothetical protein